MSRKLLVLTLLFTIFGCGTNIANYYHDGLGGKKVVDIKELEPNIGEPTVMEGTNPEADAINMQENGFALIGFTSFNGPLIDKNKFIQQAKDINAAIIYCYVNYTNTSSGSIPWTVQNPNQTATAYHSGNVTGYGGSASYTGTSTYSLPGGTTSYNIPYSVHRYDQMAAYWVKIRKQPLLGVIIRDLNSDEKTTSQRNRGVFVNAVRKESPAYKADILRGDIVLSVNNKEIDGKNDFGEMLKMHSGKEIELNIIRSGEKRNIKVILNKEQ